MWQATQATTDLVIICPVQSSVDVVEVAADGGFSLNQTQETLTAAYTWTGLEIDALVPVDEGCTGTLLYKTGTSPACRACRAHRKNRGGCREPSAWFYHKPEVLRSSV